VISGLFSIPLPESAPAAESPFAPAAARTSQQRLQFVAGPENALVRAVVDAVSGNASPYNPLVIYGESGTGKTALLHAVVAPAIASQPAGSTKRSILQTTGADFARAYANAVDTDSIADLRERYDRCDLLVIDDLHQLGTKPAAQQEFLHVFDRLQQRGGLLLAALRHLPSETRGFMPGLVSRLSAGLIVPLVLPQASARRMIVEQLAAAHEITLAPALIERLSNPPPMLRTPFATAPQLRQALLQLASRAEARRCVIDMSLLDELTAEHAPEAKAAIRQITATVAKQLAITVSELKGSSRKQAVVYARGLAMYLCRELTSASFAAIARSFGNRDHTTVMHACRRVAALIETDAATRHLIDELAICGVGVPPAEPKVHRKSN